MSRHRAPEGARPRVAFISLGCSKNLVDTEVMLGHLDGAGAATVRDPAAADVVVVNTCGFIEAAREESIRTILEAAELKRRGRAKRLVVAGCMVQRYRDELRSSLPEVDAFVGLDELPAILGAVGLPSPAATGSSLAVLGTGAALPERRRSRFLYDASTPRRLSGPPWTAFLKIAEGCDHTCAFCAIPTFRGAFRSRTVEDIVREAERLARNGVKEVCLISQDSSDFGRDRGLQGGLTGLLEALDAVEGLRWIRLHYLYPNSVDRGLVDAMARLPKVLEYVDLPLQHADADVLRRMRRGGNPRAHLDLLSRFRDAMPEAAIRSTFIVGFPGETEEEFAALLEFVASARLDHLGVFTYSHEEGTPAASLEDDVPADVKEERRGRLMALQQGIVFEKNAARVGRRFEVLVDGTHPETEHLLVGRARFQAPDVDGEILINDGLAPPGSLVPVEITETAGYDLVGRVVDGG